MDERKIVVVCIFNTKEARPGGILLLNKEEGWVPPHRLTNDMTDNKAVAMEICKNLLPAEEYIYPELLETISFPNAQIKVEVYTAQVLRESLFPMLDVNQAEFTSDHSVYEMPVLFQQVMYRLLPPVPQW